MALGGTNAPIVSIEHLIAMNTIAGRWRIELIYLALPSVEMSKLRVAERVTHGGHNIPIADIERRFARSLANLLEVFSPEVDFCRCLMNNSALPELVFEQKDTVRTIVHSHYYQHLLQEIAL